ncbi:MAG: hypothetical protein JWN20_1725, partial [Jatrophihabitantaceae bacterium]|nr:hypothetical protein [Jatrophihabitantaceae bacterium]
MALGLARRSGRSIRIVRTSIEITVLSNGWLLGGAVGIGTVAYALLIGPLSQLFLRLFGVRGSGLDASPDDAPAVLPEGAGPASAISVSTARATA